MPIKFVNVDYIYNKKTPFSYEALKNINVEILTDSITAIVGQTGCGKTTLIQQLNGLLIPTDGAVYIDNFVVSRDRKIRTKKLKPLRKHVGIVFQFPEYQLFEETVEKDVAFGPRNFGSDKNEALEIAHQALKDVGLDESFFARSPFELSGGEKRRVAIAGILALKPDILVLDEPTVGLDPRGAKDMMSLFEKVHERGTSLILITHRMDLVLSFCDRVILMDDGEIKNVTTPSELFLKKDNIYSLEIPQIIEVGKQIQQRGLSIDIKRIKDIPSLIEEVVLKRVKR
ncbi:MAG: energy-coupling factor transporter ATPase [Bacilli bacterium]|jgi:energy-coupling factor transport system ATP-binding protein